MPTFQAITAHDHEFIVLFCIVTVFLVVYPILRFLQKQWSFRRDRLFGAMLGDAVVYYYKQFRREVILDGISTSPVIHVTNPDLPAQTSQFSADTQNKYFKQFTRDFNRWYGKRYYIVPLVMLFVLTAASAWWGAKVVENLALGAAQDTYRSLVASALAGAFVWVVSDELDRLRRRDFTSSDVYYYVFRILLAIPFAWALSRITLAGASSGFGKVAAIPMAFFLGAFPTTSLFTMARRFVSQTLKLGDDQDTGSLELEKLQSVVKSNAERFQEEDINTITGLAYADPIDLTIRTNYDFNYVIDCVSQALMWIYFSENGKKLFPLSLRGAQETACIVSWLNIASKAPEANQVITDGAAIMGMTILSFRATLDQIAEDPYTKFIVDIWS
jgi:hypothetical protein